MNKMPTTRSLVSLEGAADGVNAHQYVRPYLLHADDVQLSLAPGHGPSGAFPVQLAQHKASTFSTCGRVVLPSTRPLNCYGSHALACTVGTRFFLGEKTVQCHAEYAPLN